MIRKLGVVVLLAMTSVVSAQEARLLSQANILANFVCPSAPCATTCEGPGGDLTITAREVLVFQFTAHPRRVWLNADGVHYLLGDDHSCKFGGTPSSPVVFVPSTPPPPPPKTSPLGPPPKKPGTCIGDACF
jgi:hypothetical protein